MKVFLLILGAIVLLLLCPVRLTLSRKEELSAAVEWLFLRFRLLPAPQKTKPKKEKTPQPPPQEDTAKTAKAPAPKPGDRITQYADLVGPLLAGLKKSVAYILRHVRVDRLRLELLIAREDAAETAIAYGRANQAVYTALGLLQNLLKFGQKPDVRIGFDYLGGTERAEGECRISIAPLFVLFGAVGFVAGLLWALVTRPAPQKAA